MSAPSQFSPPPQSSGGGSSALKIILIILAVLLIGCGGLCAGCLYVAGRTAKEAGKAFEEFAKLGTAYANTQSAVTSDPQVIDRLGEPIEMTSQAKRQNTGEYNTSGETFQFDIKGPKGTAIVSAVATAPDKNSPFKVTKITVTFSDGSVVDVQPPSEQFSPMELKIEGAEPK
jgi:flagellar basal body-associated protein FliL